MFSKDGKGVLIRTESGGARVWNVWTGKLIEEFGDLLNALLTGEFHSAYSSTNSPAR